MTEDDRQAIVAFFDRIRANKVEIDPEADKLIGELMARDPATRYAVTQMAFFQEHALAEAQNRVRQLEYQLSQRQGGFLGGLFGGRQGPPPAPVHAPGYRPGMFDQRRGGFLGGAASTVMAVAGGMLVGHMLGNLFSGGGAAQASESQATELTGGSWSNPDTRSGPWSTPAGATEPTESSFDDGGDAGGFDGGDSGSDF